MNSQDYVNELFNLEGHVGIVTGASRGLGMGIAQVLTNAGATVYNLDIIERSDEKEITGNMIGKRYGRLWSGLPQMRGIWIF